MKIGCYISKQNRIEIYPLEQKISTENQRGSVKVEGLKMRGRGSP
jgi:hypothetical protein